MKPNEDKIEKLVPFYKVDPEKTVAFELSDIINKINEIIDKINKLKEE